MPYSPEQNGGAERENRTLVESARTMLHSKDLPEKLWAEAVNTAAYILNRTAPTGVQEKSPLELWSGKTMPIDHFRIFGTECFVHVPKQKRKKWDRKSVKGYLVGYCGDKDGYRVWIPEKNDVILSRDVVFKEETLVPEKLEIISRNEIIDSIESDKSQETQIDARDSVISRLRDRSKLRKPEKYTAYAMLAENEPSSVEEALKSTNSEEWKAAMDEEMQSLIDNKTWMLVNPPSGRKAISNRWIFRIKEDSNGNPIRFKARLVAKGFLQKAGVDFTETFSPVARFDTIRSMLAVAASERMSLAQFDVKTAFLYGCLEEEIYMNQPEGYEDGTGRSCKLIKSLYGLKQSPRCWNRRFTDFLKSYGLEQSIADPCLFYSNLPKKLFIVLWVDDGLVAAPDEPILQDFLSKLKAEFQITNDPVSNFLGVQIKVLDSGGIFINQEQYAKKVLERFNMKDAFPVQTPIEKGQLEGEVNDDKLNDEFPFNSAVGSLMYLSVATRPDIAYAISTISQGLAKPTIAHWKAIKRVMRYVLGTLDYGIFYSPGPTALEGYSDADYAGDIETRRSTSGVVCCFGGAAVSWISKKQRCVTLSTTESEYIAGAEAAKELIWLKRLFGELLPMVLPAPILNIDNASALKLAKNPEFHKRSKHIAVKYHFLREKVGEGEIQIKHIPGEMQRADMFTKPMVKVRLKKLRESIGIQTIKKLQI